VFLFRPDLGIGLTLQALLQQNLAQILAEPNLIVVEGSEASFSPAANFRIPPSPRPRPAAALRPS
jgi:Flp pilus assembly secretin CpaC